MKLIYVGFAIVMSAVIEIKSERTRSEVCQGCQHEEYIRIKRAKYYSHPPIRFYNKPPMTHPIKGAFSFTPPPGYQMDDARQPQNSRSKVSSRPNDGLGDDDLNNIMKFLTKQDLDKIVDFANEKERESSYKREKHESKFNDNGPEFNDGDNIFHRDPYMNAQQSFRPYSIEYSNPNLNQWNEIKSSRFSEPGPSALLINKNQMRLNTHLDSERFMQDQQYSNPNPYEYQEPNENKYGANIFADNNLMQEEQLPKPSNLREDDYEVSFTNNVPTVVKPNTHSYKIENLGSLPLMNYHSKLESVDSYKVPHYTVTSPEKYKGSSSVGNIPVEPAPPVSTARQQSDAHLKATRIWTHKSRGTAYTLHDDGTLSLEKPS